MDFEIIKLTYLLTYLTVVEDHHNSDYIEVTKAESILHCHLSGLLTSY